MNQPKRHHFVPAMLQKRFVDGHGLIHFFNKSTPEKGVLSTRPGNLHLRQHLYSLHKSDGTKDVSLEERYSELESAADPMISEVVEMVRGGRCARFPPDAKELLAIFVYEQWRRVPDMHEQVMPYSKTEAQMRSALDEAEQKTGEPLAPDLRDRLLHPSSIARFGQNARVSALWRKSDSILDALKSKGVFYARCGERSCFLLGSSPVLNIKGVGNADPTHPAVEVWLPISSKLVVILAGKSDDGQIIDLPRDHVRSINLAIAKKSSIFSGSIKEIVHSISKRV